MFTILDESLFFKFLPSLWHYGIAFVDQLCDHHGDVFNWCIFKWWKKLDPHEPVPDWFKLSVVFLIGPPISPPALGSVGPLNICEFSDFVSVCDCLFQVGSDSLSVYTDSSLKNLGTIGCWAGAAAFFKDINLGLGVSVHSLVSFTLAELQAIVLALNFTDTASLSGWFLSSCIGEHFLVADGDTVSSNSRHFVWDVFHAVCYAYWEVDSGSGFLAGGLLSNVNWLSSSWVWHSNSHMVMGFTSRRTADTCTYFIKPLHYQLLIAV
ncbi:hypothetical protein G9A89_014656 [Geosiphon pyriformis]|nr:hypothetical protein G9A89_014656 [Geosiphon pyriformis]